MLISNESLKKLYILLSPREMTGIAEEQASAFVLFFFLDQPESCVSGVSNLTPPKGVLIMLTSPLQGLFWL